MAYTRRMSAMDLFRFNSVNLDSLTETYNLCFYFQYLGTWPSYQRVVESAHGRVMAYMIGKTEGEGEQWHGHVSAVTVSPEFRRLGLAAGLMRFLDATADAVDKCYFVDLFVRVSNTVAIDMYRRLGYIVYRTIVGYYSGEEDAYDMRKALSHDVHRKSVVPITRPVHPSELYLTM